MNTIHCGTFEAEALWRPPHLAVLPSISTRGSAEIVAAMDELLSVFAEPDDVLLTALPICEPLLHYLSGLGFQFRNNSFALLPTPAEDRPRQTTGQLQVFQYNTELPSAAIASLCSAGSRLALFATVPYAKAFAETYQLKLNCPEDSVMRVVNTKSYSMQLRGELGLPVLGSVVKDLASLRDAGAALLTGGGCLIKDEYGVSGKGNLRVDSTLALDRVCRYLFKQCESGREIRFVLEPFLEKALDFSCQLFVEEDGRVEILAIQALENIGLAYGGSVSPDPALHALLEKNGYMGLMERLGQKLYADGYFGHVCADSMLLENGDWVPLVEVNPRCSMSLIKHYVDRYLARLGLKGIFTSMNTMRRANLDFGSVLTALEDADLLFGPDRPAGILPMSAGTLRLEQAASSESPVFGRLYFAIVPGVDRSRQELSGRLAQALHGLGIASS